MIRIEPPAHAPDFLAAHGWAGAQILPLAADASFRRYFRVHAGDRQAVLMDAPPEKEDSKPFLAVAHWLHQQGLRAPRILAADLDLGLGLLEDFGDDRLGPYLAKNPAREQALYGDAISILVQAQQPEPPQALPFQAQPANGKVALLPYDRAVLQREVALLTDWYMPACGIVLDDAAIAAWHEVWDQALASVLNQTAKVPVMVLRDYHADNLMILDGETAAQRLGLLDFQDALAGHAAYDLVSLLQDARRDVSETLETQMLDAYWQQAPARVKAIGRDAFEASYQLLGCQRNIKIIGIFTRLHRRDGKAHYPALQPRVWRYVARNLEHPALAPVKRWLDAHVPADQRGSSPL